MHISHPISEIIHNVQHNLVLLYYYYYYCYYYKKVNFGKMRTQERKIWQNIALLLWAFARNSTNVCKIQENTKYENIKLGFLL